MNSLVLYQLAHMGLGSEDQWKLCDLARRPGLIPTFALQAEFQKKVKALGEMPGRGSVNWNSWVTRFVSRLSRGVKAWEEELNPLRHDIAESFDAYYRWVEEGQPLKGGVTYEDVFLLLHGKETPALSLSGTLVRLIQKTSQVFQSLRKQCATREGFCPDFLFY